MAKESKFYQTSHFKALEKEWEARLQASGFEDAEKIIDGERVLIQNAANAFRQADSLTVEQKTAYFDQMSQAVHNEEFTNEIDSLVMHRTAEAVKIKDIVSEIKSLGYTIHRQTVRFIIRRYENKWKIKQWTHKQMYLRVPTK